MHASLVRPSVLLATVLMLAGCSENPVGLEAPAAPEQTSGAELPQDAARHDAAPTLMRLFQQAVRRVAETQGEAAAREVAQPVIKLHEESRAAQQAGNMETARARAERAEQIMATVVVRVLGPEPVVRVVRHGAEQLKVWTNRVQQARQAGRDVRGPEQLLRAASEMHRQARSALEAREFAPALLRGARVLDLLARLGR